MGVWPDCKCSNRVANVTTCIYAGYLFVYDPEPGLYPNPACVGQNVQFWGAARNSGGTNAITWYDGNCNVNISTNRVSDPNPIQWEWRLSTGDSGTGSYVTRSFDTPETYTCTFKGTAKNGVCDPITISQPLSVLVNGRCEGGCPPSSPDMRCCGTIEFNPVFACCTPSGHVVMQRPITDLADCPHRVQYTPPVPNGCSTPTGNNPCGLPCTDFLDACNQHDVCYQTCGSDRTGCDGALQGNLLVRCGTCTDSNAVACCVFWADAYAVAVSMVGAGPYFDDQVQYCQCCPDQ